MTHIPVVIITILALDTAFAAGVLLSPFVLGNQTFGKARPWLGAACVIVAFGLLAFGVRKECKDATKLASAEVTKDEPTPQESNVWACSHDPAHCTNTGDGMREFTERHGCSGWHRLDFGKKK